jgi:hypothetical protein
MKSGPPITNFGRKYSIEDGRVSSENLFGLGPVSSTNYRHAAIGVGKSAACKQAAVS